MFASKCMFYVSLMQLVTLQLLMASSMNGQALKDVKMTLKVKQATPAAVFELIQEETGFVFGYDRAIAKMDANLSIDLEEATLETVLTQVARQAGLRFKRINSNIAVTKEPKNTSEERSQPVKLVEEYDRTISGRVTDASGEPLVGATVNIKGTVIGTITDIEGNFTLQAPDDASTILVSYIGYVPMELPIGNQSSFDIAMQIDTQALNEIIVVGYGEQKRSDYTGTISSVPKKRLEQVPNLNVAQIIQGAMPGVTITQNQAGAASSESIIIRGRNSILANNGPLIVVDRVPYNGELRDINVNDIASVEVLRDASATAIYGSRGANGVILITTKGGDIGKTVVSYDGRYAIQRFDQLPNYMSGPEFLAFKEIREPGNVTVTEQQNIDAGNFTDWQDLAVRDGYSQQHNLAVSGGTERVNYYFGAGYLDVQGVTLNDDYTRITGRLNLDININDWISIGTRTQYSDDDRSGVGLDLSDIGRKNPLINVYEDNGDLTIFPWPEFTDIGNPLEPINYDNTDEARQLLTNNYMLIDFPFLEGLSYRLNTGITERFADISTYRGRNTKAGLEAGGMADTETSRLNTSVIENILNYNNAFDQHTVGVTALYSYQQDKVTTNLLHAEGFPNDITSYYNAAQAQVIVPEYRFTQTDLISTMLRVNYGFREKYLLTLTGRRDGYSGFGASDKWGTFGTVAGAWVISRENFFPWQEALSFFKLRASYGANGNQAVGPYESIARFRESNFVDGETSLPGFVPDNLANPRLGWETSRSTNLGLDFGLLNDRLTGSIDYFNTNTEDLLLNRTISPVQGIPSIVDNIGETKNSGIELSLNSTQVIGGKVSWNANANFSYIRNEIVSLGLGANGDVDDVASGLFIGEPITSNFDFLFDGVWQENEADQAATFDTQPGFVKIRDVNADGEITADDRTIIGQTDPTHLWGLTNTFGYKNFSLTLFVHGVHGVTKENRLFQDASSSSGVRRNVIAKNWWTPDNPTNDFYSNHIDAGIQQGFGAPIYQDASFIRFKDITLAYDFPTQWLEKIGMSRVNLYFTGRNLLTITDWQESDPELDSGRGTIPLQREYVFGITFRN